MATNEPGWQHQYYLRLKARREMHQKQDKSRSEIAAAWRGNKVVRVEYPESTLSDWYTMAEYKRRQCEFSKDALIWIDGVRQVKQDTLF
jgi:hypothetical protein